MASHIDASVPVLQKLDELSASINSMYTSMCKYHDLVVAAGKIVEKLESDKEYELSPEELQVVEALVNANGSASF